MSFTKWTKGRIIKHMLVDLLMKHVTSFKSLRKRSKKIQIVKRRGHLYLIDKLNPRFKARQ